MTTNIKQIAEFARVSPGTVSKALSGRSGVRAETRQRIKDLAERLNYQPSGLGRSLVRGKTEYIGLDYQRGNVPGGTMPVMLQSIENRLRERDYSMMLVTRLNNEVRVPRIIRQRMVDGIIVAHDRDREVEEFASNAGLAHVLLNVAPLPDCDCVCTDNENGTRLAVRHLVELGHRHIAFVNSMHANVHSSQTQRVTGYVRAMSEAGLVAVPGAEQTMPIEANVTRHLARDTRPTAFVCFNDLVAAQVIHQLRRRGLSVPHDASVIGCDDDLEVIRYLNPPLTTLHLPLQEMGAGAARLVLDRLEDPDREPRTLSYTQHLVVRESTAPPMIE